MLNHDIVKEQAHVFDQFMMQSLILTVGYDVLEDKVDPSLVKNFQSKLFTCHRAVDEEFNYEIYSP